MLGLCELKSILAYAHTYTNSVSDCYIQTKQSSIFASAIAQHPVPKDSVHTLPLHQG